MNEKKLKDIVEKIETDLDLEETKNRVALQEDSIQKLKAELNIA